MNDRKLISLILKVLSDDVYEAMLEDDEMWYIDPVTLNGTIYYDLPLLDC